jgi:hypothetical protein
MTSLISISGKIGSGKDLTGKIIQAFLEFPLASNENILRMALSGIDNPKSQIKNGLIKKTLYVFYLTVLKSNLKIEILKKRIRRRMVVLET